MTVNRDIEVFLKLPRYNTIDGRERKIGFEFELSAVSLQECAAIIKNLYGGEIYFEHSLYGIVKNTSLGDFKVELDSQLVQKIADSLENHKYWNGGEEPKWTPEILNELSKITGSFAQLLVPFEIVTPPVTLAHLPDIEKLRAALFLHNAQGINSSFINAFGMHINIETPSFKVEEILSYLRAFLILYPWLKEVMNIALSRRILTYIDPFPENYIKLILENSYQPSLDEFIDDYLIYNPTRNRALDLLPLFAHIKPEKLQELDRSITVKVKARPAFHYRLPNCEINDRRWRIARDWNYWIEVEKLATDKTKLKKLGKKYLLFLNKAFHDFSDEWIQYTQKQLTYAA